MQHKREGGSGAARHETCIRRRHRGGWRETPKGDGGKRTDSDCVQKITVGGSILSKRAASFKFGERK